VYGRVKAVQPQTALELVVATNIKEYLPRHLAALFTLFKEKRKATVVSLAPGDRWFQDLLRANDGATPPAGSSDGEDDAIVLASGGTTAARQRAWSASTRGSFTPADRSRRGRNPSSTPARTSSCCRCRCATCTPTSAASGSGS
jgi:hypothetical protein